MRAAQFTFMALGFPDTKEEIAKNVNGLRGSSLANWLAARLAAAGCEVTEVWPEDYGWEFNARQGEAWYTCSCVIERDTEGDAGPPRWEGQVLVTRKRSLMDRLLSRNQLSAAEDILALIERELRASPDASQLVIDPP